MRHIIGAKLSSRYLRVKNYKQQHLHGRPKECSFSVFNFFSDSTLASLPRSIPKESHPPRVRSENPSKKLCIHPRDMRGPKGPCSSPPLHELALAAAIGLKETATATPREQLSAVMAHVPQHQYIMQPYGAVEKFETAPNDREKSFHHKTTAREFCPQRKFDSKGDYRKLTVSNSTNVIATLPPPSIGACDV
jgi:hypothetical protein